MLKRNLIIIAVVLGVLALAAQYISSPKKGLRDSRINKTLASVDLVEKVDEIVIENNDSIIHLQKIGNNWRIKEKDGYLVNVQEILTLLEKITSYKVASIVTQNKDRLAYFKLLYKTEGGDSKSVGSQLILKAEQKPLYTLLVGRHRDSISKSSNVPSYPDGTYIRIGDDVSVFLIKENLALDLNPNAWVQKKLVMIEEDQIKAVRYETQTDRFILSRESKERNLVLSGLGKDEKTSDFERSTMVNALKEFTVDDVISRNQKLESGLEMKSDVSVELFDQSIFEFQVFAKTVSDPLKKKESEKKLTYYLKLVVPPSEVSQKKWEAIYSLADKWLFEIEEWRAKKWLKSRKEFITAEDKAK